MESAAVMCVDISIISDSEDEQDRECFAFIISTTAMEGVSLEMTQATICIIDDDGIYNLHVNVIITALCTIICKFRIFRKAL